MGRNIMLRITMLRITRAGAAIVVAFAAVPAVSFADVQCRNHFVGVIAEGSAETLAFTATAKAEALVDTEESKSLAEAEARLAARAMLLKVPEVPQPHSGRLRGAVDLGSCADGLQVYGTVRLEVARAKYAAQMEDMMQDSIKEQPLATTK